MNLRRIAIFAVPLLCVVALFSVFASMIGRDTSFVPSVLINKPVPEFTLTAIDSLEQTGFSSADLRGEVFVVNVWASWCVPCRDEHEFLVRLKAEQDIKLFGINQKDQSVQAIAFLDELGNPFDAIGADTNGRVSIEWGVYGVPETFVVNAQGIITYKHIGPISEQSYADSLLPAIQSARQE